MNTEILAFKFKMAFFVLLFMFSLDFLFYRALRRIFKNSPKKLKFYSSLHWSIAIISFLSFAAFLFFPELEKFKGLKAISSGIVSALYLSKVLFSLFAFTEGIARLFTWIFKSNKKIAEKVEGAIKEEKIEAAEPKIPAKEKMSRAEFLYKGGIIASAVPFVLLSNGVISGAYNYKIRRVRLPIKGLPLAFENYKIVQISDIHTGSFYDKKAVNEGINMILAEKPNAVFFTGDMVNNAAFEMDEYLEMFARIQAPDGVFSVLGNHDYGEYMKWPSEEAKIENFNNLLNHHKNLNWRLLRNEHEFISKGDSKLAIIGVENWGDRGRFQKFGDVHLATENIGNADVKLLLSHDPSHWDAKVRKENPDINVMFSGHTHGMQFGIENRFIKWSPVQYIYKQWAGLYQENNQMLYVNRGYGFIGYPGRVGIMPEITVFELSRA